VDSVEYRLLGPLEVSVNGSPVALGAPRQRAVLGALLLHANHVVTVDRLGQAVWWEPPRSESSNLRSYVTGLRQHLTRAGIPAERIGTRPSGYLMRVKPGELDLLVFERFAARGSQAVREGKLEAATAWLGDALRLWRGQPLEAVSQGPLLHAEAVRLEEWRLVVTERYIQARLASRQHGDLLPELRSLVAAHPLRERFWAQLMLALYRSGRQADALAAYAQVRTCLAEELGVDPGPDLQRLQAQILRSDPALEDAEADRHQAAGTGSATARATAPAPTAVRPRQLPRDLRVFAGREAQLRSLRRLLADDEGPGPAVVVIDGVAGAGKSALATRAAHLVRDRFPDGELYADLQGTAAGLEPVDPAEVLGRFLRALGIAPAWIPVDAAEAAAYYRSLLADRRILVVLDDAAGHEQVRPLLPPSSGSAALVTSRTVLAALDGASRLHLGRCSMPEALELLAGLVDGSRILAELQAATRLAQLCDRLPLALRIAAARLAARPSWPVAALVERLEVEHTRLDELRVGDLDVRAGLLASYRTLRHSQDPADQDAACAFRVLGAQSLVGVEPGAAATLLGLPAARAERALERLVDVHLLQSPRPGRYQMRDLVRLFAREQARLGQEPARQC
jgi:DNA-binding SARP family transcriptional activator